MRRLSVLALVVGVLVSACASSKEEAVERAMSDFWTSFATADAEGFCDALAPEALNQVFAEFDRIAPQAAGQSCPEAFAAVAPTPPPGFDAGELEFEETVIDGARARVTFRRAGQSGEPSEAELRRVGDRWLFTTVPGAQGAGSPQTPPVPANVTKEEAIERADATCRGAQERTGELIDRLDLEDADDLQELDRESLAIAREAAQTPSSLAPPAGERPLFDRFVASIGLSADLREKALAAQAAGDIQAAEQASRQLVAVREEGGRAAADYGMADCARLGE